MIELEKVLEGNSQKWKEKEHIYEKINGKYVSITYGDFIKQTRCLAKYLISCGLKNKAILIYGNNSAKFMMADLAVLHYVGISVCVSKEWKENELKQAIKRLDIACVLYGEEKKDIIEEVAKDCKAPIYILMEEALASSSDCDYKELELADSESCCKIVFSSGTTAEPKAVMLSEKNIFAGLDSMYRRCPFNENDVDYLCLPLSHTYAGIYNFLYSMVFGFSIYLCSDNAVMAREILEVNPTLFCGVPLIYKRFYEGYGSNIAKAFGNRIKYLFCGGALMDENIRRVYKDNGLNMMEAYALSETASTFAIQYPYDSDVKTVGTIAEDIDVKLINTNEEGIGEVVVKGDNVFIGYATNPELTKKSFTEDGYFKTGDVGYLKEDEVNGGYKLYITGRIKKVLIGENGENIEPSHIEEMICARESGINKAQLFIKDGKLCCRIYIKSELSEKKWDIFFEKLNLDMPAYEKIKQYEVIVDSDEKRWKQ
ncbi:MAG: AMP-binding protein [Lachnospiraceae bacterium]|nr:AMP-binding protein [Lachnospiraceae bacterium]